MKIEDPRFDELRQLLVKNDSEPLSRKEEKQLNNLLLLPGAASVAVDLLQQIAIFANLESSPELLKELEVAIEVPPANPLPNGWTFGRAIHTIGLPIAIVFTGIVIWFVSQRSQIGEVARVHDIKPNIGSIESNFLTELTPCVWAGGSPPGLASDDFSEFNLHLLQGICQMSGSIGGRECIWVRISGPVKVNSDADGMLELESGCLTVRTTGDVPISILTPAADIRLSGDTAVGLYASNSRCEIHVFNGSANIGADLRLNAGQSACFTTATDGSFAIDRLGDASFLRFGFHHEIDDDLLLTGMPYEDSMKTSNPAIYWDFSDTDPGSEKSNSLGYLKGMSISKYGKVDWRELGDNRFLQSEGTYYRGKLGSPKSRPGCLVADHSWPPEPLEEFTLELWAKSTVDGNRTIVSFVGDLDVDGEPVVEAALDLHGPVKGQEAGFAYRFFQNLPDGEGIVSCEASKSFQVCKWHHLVVRKVGRTIDMTVDGQTVGEAADFDFPFPSGLRIVVGKRYPDATSQEFWGQIDEIAFYERALTDNEIRGHFEAARKQN